MSATGDPLAVELADNDVRYVPQGGVSFVAIAHESRYHWAATAFDLTGKSVVDFGCGSGYGAGRIAEQAAFVLGLDISPTSIAYAQETFGKPNIEFRACDLSDKALPAQIGRQFDVLVSFDVIEHVERFYDFAANSAALLSDDGTALIGCPNRLETFTWNEVWNPFHMQEFTPHQLEWLLSHYYGKVEIFGQDFRDPAVKAAAIPKPYKPSPLRSLIGSIPGVRPLARLVRGPPPTIPGFTFDDITFAGGGTSFGLVAVCKEPLRAKASRKT